MSFKTQSTGFLVSLLLLLPNILTYTNQAQQVFNPSSITALYVFGDSYVDPGNNNYIPSILKSNFPPYGIDFVNHKPTGRFTDGKLIADILASYLGFQNYVPYLDPNFTIQTKPAVGFASSSTGFDDRTASIFNVIRMSKQLEYFKEYKAKLASTIGEVEADYQTKNAVFLVNCAVNDFVITYYGPGRALLPLGSTIEKYEEFVLQRAQEFIQGLVGLGARRIAMSGVPLFGCWPYVITFYSTDPITRTCNETLNFVGYDYNAKVQAALKTMQISLASQGVKLAYFDTYQPMVGILQNPAKYGMSIIINFERKLPIAELGALMCPNAHDGCCARSKSSNRASNSLNLISAMDDIEQFIIEMRSNPSHAKSNGLNCAQHTC